MKRIGLPENFFKDVIFNTYTYKKYLFVDKLILICGILLNLMSFLLYSATGIRFFVQVDSYLRMINALAITGIFAIRHRINVNELNISRKLSELDYSSFFKTNIKEIEIIPFNFKLNENLPLKELKKIYKEGAYYIVSTYEREFIFKVSDKATYLIEDEDSLELDQINRLRLTR